MDKTIPIPAFSLFDCPLAGSHLLEASAGTGKTYSLSFLYIRLLIEKQFSVEEILVTTFTKLATAELGQRIYQLIQEIEAMLLEQIDSLTQSTERTQSFTARYTLQELQEQGDHSSSNTQVSPELLAWLDKQFMTGSEDACDVAALQAALWRLKMARAQFDHAQIYTIDAFAAKLLNEQAVLLETFVPQTVISDDDELVALALAQLARDNFAALDAPLANSLQAIAESGKTYSDWLADLQKVVTNISLIDRQVYDDVISQCQHAEALVNQVATMDVSEELQMLTTYFEKDYFDKRKWKLSQLATYAAQLQEPLAHFGGKKKLWFEWFSLSEINKVVKGDNPEMPEMPLFCLCEELLPYKACLQKRKEIDYAATLLGLADAVIPLIANEKARQLQKSYSDITQVIAEHIEKLTLPYQAALVDEAQDTSKPQLEIFKKAFVNEGKTCFFVGDPKQAIYGFRGGDIYAYLAIQRIVAHSWRLDTNYRSTDGLNASVNYLFSGENPFIESRIAYYPIKTAAHNIEQNATDLAPLRLVMTEGNNENDFAEAAALQIHTLIRKGQAKRNEIAILVWKNDEATAMKQALAKYGISISATTKDSVYESQEAKWLHLLLSTLTQSHVGKIRSLLLSGWFGPLIETDGEPIAETQVNDISNRLFGLAKNYPKTGFSGMMYQLLYAFSIPANILKQNDGKRKLTNLMHLISLLQSQAEKPTQSLFGLMQWLGYRIHHKDKETELRLDDTNAVRLMTVHSAKGLQFDTVVLPFLGKRKKPDNSLILRLNQANSAIFSSWASTQHLDDYNKESTSETIRQIYVALTRAKRQNILVLPKPKTKKGANNTDFENSSLMTKLVNVLPDDFSVLCEQPFVTMIDVDDLATQASNDGLQEDENQSVVPVYRAKRPTKAYPVAWELDSFSRLQQRFLPYGAGHAHADGVDAVIDSGVDSAAELSLESSHLPAQSNWNWALLQFPAGVTAGLAIHELYEYIMAWRPNENELTAFAERIYEKYGFDKPVTGNATPSPANLSKALLNTIDCPLAPFDFRLSQIDVKQQRIEMPFFLHLSTQAKAQLLAYFKALHSCTSSDTPSDTRPVKTMQTIETIESYLSGFIDYWFAFDGKFYLLDYKSNKLGDSATDYDGAGMAAEMAHHGYDRQALIYTLALCRYLRIKTKADYEDKIGGYFYLFIRGMHHAPDTDASRSLGVYYHRLDWDSISPLLEMAVQ